jgi:hypothetical protein
MGTDVPAQDGAVLGGEVGRRGVDTMNRTSATVHADDASSWYVRRVPAPVLGYVLRLQRAKP